MVQQRYAVINYKGGTGKTTTVINLCHGLSLQGKKVLLVDTDPQGSVGHYFGLNPKKTLYDVLINKEKVEDCIVNLRYNFDALLSNERIFPAEIKISRVKNREFFLQKALESCTGYDYIFVDCAPSMNLLNQNALIYARQLILPVSMEYLSLIGVKQLLKNIKIINKLFNRKVVISHVIPTFYDKRYKKSRDVLESLSRVFPDMLTSSIRYSLGLSEAPGHKMTIFEYDPNSLVASDYFSIVEGIIKDG